MLYKWDTASSLGSSKISFPFRKIMRREIPPESDIEFDEFYIIEKAEC